MKNTKGFRGSRSKLFRPAKNAMMKALSNAYIGRKQKKRILDNYGLQELMQL